LQIPINVAQSRSPTAASPETHAQLDWDAYGTIPDPNFPITFAAGPEPRKP